LIKNKISIENILDTIPVGFIIFNQNYEVIKTNKQALNLFKTSNEEDLMKKTCKDIFTDQDVQICPFMTDSSKPVTNELKIKTINGEIKSVIKNATIIELDGEKVVLETFIDITKRKETEENLKLAKESAEMATHEKSKFLASMSHEIRTPLNGIIGMASMLQNTELNDQQQNFLEIIQVSSNNLVSIISDILDFSKIEAGEIQIDKHSFNIARELDNNLKALHLKADEKGIKVNFHVLEEVPEYIFGDSVRIKQIFINLVSNAIKFTEKGQVDVFLSYNTKLTKFRVSVRDTGIGIPKNRLNSIFTAFSQTDGSITRKFGGTGLGLTISKELAELMQGSIGVESTEGIGSEFWFEIPAKAGEKPKELEKAASPLNKTKEKLNILVAEDNKINQKVASVIFQKLGYQIDLAENGLEALEKFKNNLYHIIFMDIQMPMMDGITATEKILDWADKQNHNVFITAMTANALKEDKQKCLNAGMKFFISKPIRPENIEESIEFYYKTGKV
jgi:PAS domain S-box-containing protein